MSNATLQILGQGTSAVPLDVPITGNQLLDLISVKADFDGGAAGVDFVPMVEIVSDAGVVMAQAKGPTVLAGDSATVTFFPFGAEEASTSTGTITEIESTDFSIQVTNPFGPIVDLSGFQPATEEEIVSFGPVSVPALGGFNVDFAHVSGATLLDYTAPAAPTFLGFGAYTFTLDIAAASNFSGNFSLRFAWSVADGSTHGALFKFSAGEQIDQAGLCIGTLAVPTQTVVLQVTNTDPVNPMTINGQGPLVKFLRF